MIMRKLLITLSAILCLVLNGLSQSKTVSGIIVDNNGQPLAGVSVIPVGSKTRTATNTNGSFTLEVSQPVKFVEVSYVGFNSQTVAVPAEGSLMISLLPGTSNLDEVVIMGYTRLRKSQYAGAASKVTKDKINFVPNASFDQILQGKSPGLTVMAGSGQ